MDSRLKTFVVVACKAVPVIVPVVGLAFTVSDHYPKATDASCNNTGAQAALYCRAGDNKPQLPYLPWPIAGAKLATTTSTSANISSSDIVKLT